MPVETEKTHIGAAEMPRVAVLSLRELEAHVSRANGYNFEDVILADLDDAQLLLLGPGGSNFSLRLSNWLQRNHLRIPVPGLRSMSTELEADVDLFFFNPAIIGDLRYLAAVRYWRERSRVAVCWLQEVWLQQIPTLTGFLDLLNRFDHVIVPFHHSTAALAARLTCSVSFLPWGVDAELFCPFPNPPPRVIDICRIGRIADETHADLLEYADVKGRFYSYDTISGRFEAPSPAAHRRNLAGMLKRTKYFPAYVAKAASQEIRGLQLEFGTRYVEGVAAGAVLLGDRVDNPAFDTWFGWPDAVVSAPYGSRDLPEVIESLEADPARVSAIRMRNVAEALRRHDHLHRWEHILAIAGLSPLPKLERRRARLADLAAMAQAAVGERSSPSIRAGAL